MLLQSAQNGCHSHPAGFLACLLVPNNIAMLALWQFFFPKFMELMLQDLFKIMAPGLKLPSSPQNSY